MSFEFSQAVRMRKMVVAEWVCGVSAILMLAGCATPTTIKVDDPKVSVPSIRLGVSLEDDNSNPSAYQSGSAIELGFSKAQGNGDQKLVSGQVMMGGVIIPSPETIHNEFDFNYSSLAYRWRKFPNDRKIGFELSGGLARASLGMDLTTATQSASDQFIDLGLHYGAAIIWRARPTTTLQLRLAGFSSGISFDDVDTGISSLGRYELLLTQALGESIELRAGYAKWEINGSAGAFQSDFRTSFSGPEIELGFNF
jgi:hypothetical protein